MHYSIIDKSEVPERERKGREKSEIVKCVLSFLEKEDNGQAIKFEFENNKEMKRQQGILCGYRARHCLKFEVRGKGTTLYVFRKQEVKE